MPKYCPDCIAYRDRNDSHQCEAIKEIDWRGHHKPREFPYRYDFWDKKPDWCPLEEVLTVGDYLKGDE